MRKYYYLYRHFDVCKRSLTEVFPRFKPDITVNELFSWVLWNQFQRTTWRPFAAIVQTKNNKRMFPIAFTAALKTMGYYSIFN